MTDLELTEEERALIVGMRDGTITETPANQQPTEEPSAEPETFPQGTEKLHPDSYGEPAEA